MAGVKYKEYSPEEDRIYSESITKIREGMKNGLTFSEACQVHRCCGRGTEGIHS